MNPLDLAVGAGSMVGAIFLYLGLTKGFTYAQTTFSSWWGKATTELKTIVADLESRVTALEGKIGITKPPAPPAA